MSMLTLLDRNVRARRVIYRWGDYRFLIWVSLLFCGMVSNFGGSSFDSILGRLLIEALATSM